MNAFYSDRFEVPLPEGHTFPMAKYRLLRERVLADGILLLADLHEPPAAEWETLALVHTADYLDAVRRGTLGRDEQRRIGFPWSPEMVERSRRSVGGTIAASRAALAEPERAAVNLSGGTHHAFSNRGEGYCVFNDVAVAARALLRDGLATRIAIVDCDVHQGHGTAAIFRQEPAIFTFSIHGANNFPFRKERSDLDAALPDGAGDEEYLALLARHLPEVLGQHRPDFVFYLAGADPYEGDRLGRLAISIDGLRRRDRMVLDACAALPLTIVMAGGHATAIADIVEIHANTVREACRTRRSERSERAPGAAAPQESGVWASTKGSCS